MIQPKKAKKPENTTKNSGPLEPVPLLLKDSLTICKTVSDQFVKKKSKEIMSKEENDKRISKLKRIRGFFSIKVLQNN